MSYQAVYDAASMALDISHLKGQAGEWIHIVGLDLQRAAEEMRRPFVLLKPQLFKDGNAWGALYGANLQEGVCGFGDSPDEASREFDKAWLAKGATP